MEKIDKTTNANFYFVKENEIGDFNFFINHQVNNSSRNSLFFIIDKSVISQKVNPFNYFKKMQVDLFKILGHNEFKFLKNLEQMNKNFNQFINDIIPYGTFTNETSYRFDVFSEDVHFSYEKKILIILKLIFLINRNTNKSVNIFINDDLDSFSFDYRTIFRDHLNSKKRQGDLNIFTRLNNYLALGSLDEDASQKVIQLYRDKNNKLNEKEIFAKFNKDYLYEFVSETNIFNLKSKPTVLIPNIKYKYLLDKKFLITHNFLVYVDLTHLNYYLRVIKELGYLHRTKVIYYDLNKVVTTQIKNNKVSSKKIAKNERIDWISYDEALANRVSSKWRNNLNLEPINYFIDDRLYNKTKIYSENETVEKVAKLNQENSIEEKVTKENIKKSSNKNDLKKSPISDENIAELSENETSIQNDVINLTETEIEQTEAFDNVIEHNNNAPYTDENLKIEVFEANDNTYIESNVKEDNEVEGEINIDKILIEEVTKLSMDDLAKINLLNQNNLLSIALTERLNHYTKEYDKQALTEAEIRQVIVNTLSDFLRTKLIKNNMPKQKRVKSAKKSNKRWNK